MVFHQFFIFKMVCIVVFECNRCLTLGEGLEGQLSVLSFQKAKRLDVHWVTIQPPCLLRAWPVEGLKGQKEKSNKNTSSLRWCFFSSPKLLAFLMGLLVFFSLILNFVRFWSKSKQTTVFRASCFLLLTNLRFFFVGKRLLGRWPWRVQSRKKLHWENESLELESGRSKYRNRTKENFDTASNTRKQV